MGAWPGWESQAAKDRLAELTAQVEALRKAADAANTLAGETRSTQIDEM